VRRALAVAAVACGLSHAGGAEADDDARGQAARELAERLAVIERTDAAIVRTKERRRAHLETRARALYKLERAASSRAWLDAAERENAAWRRLIARRLIQREAREIELLAHERDAMVRARISIFEAMPQIATASIPVEGSLVAPVPGSLVSPFGTSRDADSSTWLSRRGIRLSAAPGAPVLATAAGQIVHAGVIRNLGKAVVIEHDDGVRSIIADLGELEVDTGDRVARGQVIGVAPGDAIYLEVRLKIGAEGFPIDPEPLLAEPPSP
jgi:murein hydrolase activator